LTPKRKTPIKHRVRTHKRKSITINTFTRGKDLKILKIANPIPIQQYNLKFLLNLKQSVFPDLEKRWKLIINKKANVSYVDTVYEEIAIGKTPNKTLSAIHEMTHAIMDDRELNTGYHDENFWKEFHRRIKITRAKGYYVDYKHDPFLGVKKIERHYD